MRTIKFRAYHTGAKEMLYGETRHVFEWEHEGQPIKIMQFTGLHDKNGKEIYEGDILKFDDNRIAEVIWFETGWNIQSKPHSKIEKSYSKMDKDEGESLIIQSASRYGKLKHSEVIGNIHENPELI